MRRRRRNNPLLYTTQGQNGLLSSQCDAGPRYFFTVTLADRASALSIERIADLRMEFRAVRAQRPFTIVLILEGLRYKGELLY